MRINRGLSPIVRYDCSLFGNISLGSTVNVMNTKFNNTVYKENNSLVKAAVEGGFGAGIGTFAGKNISYSLDNYLMFNSLYTTARQINYISNTTGKVTSASISGVATPLVQDMLDKMK